MSLAKASIPFKAAHAPRTSGVPKYRSEKNTDTQTRRITESGAQHAPERVELGKGPTIAPLRFMVKTPDLKEYCNELYRQSLFFQAYQRELSKDKHNSPMNAGASFKIDVGTNIPQAVAANNLLIRTEPSSKQSGCMPNSAPNVPLLSFVPQESTLPEIRPDKPRTSISNLCSQVPMVNDCKKNQVWQQLKTADNPTISTICTGVQMSSATFPDRKFQEIIKKHQKNANDKSKIESEHKSAEHEHETKLGAVQAADSKLLSQRLPKLQRLLPARQHFPAPPPPLDKFQPPPSSCNSNSTQAQTTQLTEDIRKVINRRSLKEMKAIFMARSLSIEQIQHILKVEKEGRSRKRMINFLTKMYHAKQQENNLHPVSESVTITSSVFPQNMSDSKVPRSPPVPVSSKPIKTTPTINATVNCVAPEKSTDETTVEQLSLEKITFLLQNKIPSAEQIQKMFIEEKNVLRRRDVLELLANSIRDCCTSSGKDQSQMPSDCKVDSKCPLSRKIQHVAVSNSTSSNDDSSEENSSDTSCESDGNIVDPVLTTSPSFTPNAITDITSQMISLQSQSLTLQTSLQTAVRKLSVEKMRSILKACRLSRAQLQHLLREELKGRKRKLMIHLLDSRISQAPEQLQEKDLAIVKPKGHLGQKGEIRRIEGYKHGELEDNQLKVNPLIVQLDKNNRSMPGDTNGSSMTASQVEHARDYMHGVCRQDVRDTVKTSISTFSQQTMQTIQELIKERSFAETKGREIKHKNSSKNTRKRRREVDRRDDTCPSHKKRSNEAKVTASACE